MPAIAETRLPFLGPTKRKRGWPSSSESGCCPVAKIEVIVHTRSSERSTQMVETMFVLQLRAFGFSVRFGVIGSLITEMRFTGSGRFRQRYSAFKLPTENPFAPMKFFWVDKGSILYAISTHLYHPYPSNGESGSGGQS